MRPFITVTAILLIAAPLIAACSKPDAAAISDAVAISDAASIKEGADSLTADVKNNVGNAAAAATTDAKDIATHVARDSMPKSGSNALLNPNTVTHEQLAAVAGLTPAAAQALVAARPFTAPSELHAALAPMLDADALAQVYKVMFIAVNPNTAPEAEAMLIPSVLKPKHLAHEFEEYAPFSDMANFRKEMGKYMDAEALADLERYITLD